MEEVQAFRDNAGRLHKTVDSAHRADLAKALNLPIENPALIAAVIDGLINHWPEVVAAMAPLIPQPGLPLDDRAHKLTVPIPKSERPWP